ncbi:MAG: glycosyltransferase family 2 protein [Lachnospiraceae bacterium]|nr:glycosyltransferase family 2 protein [Lachnospiraceae bacterium]
MKTLIIIPSYNEAENICQVVDNIILNYPQYDYLVVNDASADETARICREHHYCFLDQPINLGIGGTVQNGYQYALENDYDIAVQIDGDGQHDVRFLPKMIELIEQGKADIVIGSRFITREGFQSSASRRMGISILSRFIQLLTFRHIKDVTSGFRAVNQKFITIYAHDYPQDYPEPEAIVTAIMYRGTILEYPVVMKERAFGSSSINFTKSMYYMIKVMIALFIRRISFGVRRG